MGLKKLLLIDVDYKSNVGFITERNICNLLGSEFANPHYISFTKYTNLTKNIKGYTIDPDPGYNESSILITKMHRCSDGRSGRGHGSD